MLKSVAPRIYQQTIFNSCSQKNILVVLPTGMGKTMIALMLAIQRLKNFPNSKILFLAPTKPLAEQHLNTFKKHIEMDENRFVLFTGFVAPEKREMLWKDAQFIFSTPQGLENDLISDRINIEDVSLIVFDECHRATGDYSYVFVAKQYFNKAKHPRILGLTASPGSDMEKIKEICNNLFIEGVEIRTDDDNDVKPYIQNVNMDWKYVNLSPPLKETKKFMEDFLKDRMRRLKDFGYVNSAAIANMSKKELLGIQGRLHAEIAQGDKSFEILKSISLLAEIMKMSHALELLETQGVAQLYNYFSRLENESAGTKVQALKNLVADANFKSAFIKISKLYEDKIEHPKLIELQKIVGEEVNKNKNTKMIVFTQYRDSAVDIHDKLSKIQNVKPKIFVGQMKKGETGLSQKDQIKILNEFKNNEFNVLISSSVGEEGLDIPQVDIVIFYEPIPSAIRTIQRKGRTGRLEKGRVIMLVTNDTRDIGYKWSAYHKEKRMYRNLESLKGKIGFGMKPEKMLNSFSEDVNIKIFADYREKGSGVIKELIEQGISIKLDKLEVADYIISARCGIEFKTVHDFVDSLIDGRLLEQLKNLKRNFERPIILVEGVEDIYSIRKVHPNAIRGMLATIAVSYGIPILQTKNKRESASLLAVMAKREQEETGKDFSLHGEKKPLSLKEQQEFVVSALPNVGPIIAKDLLKEFKNVKNIVNASEDELQKVNKVGEKIAKQIKDVVEKDYI